MSGTSRCWSLCWRTGRIGRTSVRPTVLSRDARGEWRQGNGTLGSLRSRLHSPSSSISNLSPTVKVLSFAKTSRMHKSSFPTTPLGPLETPRRLSENRIFSKSLVFKLLIYKGLIFHKGIIYKSDETLALNPSSPAVQSTQHQRVGTWLGTTHRRNSPV